MSGLAGRTAIVTGALGGIGSAIVRMLAEEGAQVLATDLAEAGASASSTEPALSFARLDEADAQAWPAIIALAEDRHGPVSILVNAAGPIGAGLIEELDVALWNRVLAVNLSGTVFGMKAVLPSMWRAGGGAIVNISSTAGLAGYPDRAAYVASKWGVRGVTKTAALEFARDHVRVNSVHPGPIRTPLTAGYPESAWARQPVPRFGEPEEVARLVRYLVAEADYVTGAEFVIDGGLTTGLAYRREDA
jgi:3alpha(or 20beta)-hydroxysteroid dehydrogenase